MTGHFSVSFTCSIDFVCMSAVPGMNVAAGLGPDGVEMLAFSVGSSTWASVFYGIERQSSPCVFWQKKIYMYHYLLILTKVMAKLSLVKCTESIVTWKQIVVVIGLDPIGAATSAKADGRGCATGLFVEQVCSFRLYIWLGNTWTLSPSFTL